MKENQCFIMDAHAYSKRLEYRCVSNPDMCLYGRLRSDHFSCKSRTKYGLCMNRQARAEVLQRLRELVG